MDMDLFMQIMGGESRYAGDQSTTFTPPHIAKEMVDLLPDSVWNDKTTFLDLCCKTGVFLVEIYNRLDKALKKMPEYIDDQVRQTHIFNEQLFGLSISDGMPLLMSQRNVYGAIGVGNIRYIGADNINYAGIIKQKDIDLLKGCLQKEFGKMNFDVVIGNPPYNRGMDLDFVYKGFLLSTQYTCMITPAKWQTGISDSSLDSETINYEEFRKRLVPKMSYVKFYPNSKDVFDAQVNSGITYFLMDKCAHEQCIVSNEFSSFPKHYNSTTRRNIQDGFTLCNTGAGIIDCIDYNNGKFRYLRKKSSNKKWVVWGTAAMPMYLQYTPELSTPQYMTSDLKIDLSANLRLSADSFIFFESDCKGECEQFVSYTYTKLFRFLASCNICVYKGWNKPETFKYIPAPTVLDKQGKRIAGSFDHIYTDAEQYKTFNLPQNYIDTIEAVIKERK